MINNKLSAIIIKNEKNLIKLASPLVGKIIFLNNKIKYLSDGELIAKIIVLNKIFSIISPESINGPVKKINKFIGSKLSYNDIIITINNKDIKKNNGLNEKIKDKYITESYTSPIDGLFYRKPSINEKTFIKRGDIIHNGQILGLIEIMKCFYELKYDGLKSKKIHKICFKNESSVNTGDKLFEFIKI